MMSTEVGVEDMSGACVLLALYNFPGLFQASEQTIDAYLPMGQILLVREPWLKSGTAVANANSFIRVDSPSDVTLLYGCEDILCDTKWFKGLPKSPTSPAVDLALNRGRQHFKDRLYLPAAYAWSFGLKIDPSSTVLRLNRSQAYLKLEWYGAALADASAILDSSDGNSTTWKKANYRAATSLYELGNYQEASRYFSIVSGSEGVDGVTRSEARTREQSQGSYDWTKMLSDGRAAEVPRLDVADFVGPVRFQTMPSRGGGRGVVASRRVKAGDVLASPGFGYSCHVPCEYSSGTGRTVFMCRP